MVERRKAVGWWSWGRRTGIDQRPWEHEDAQLSALVAGLDPAVSPPSTSSCVRVPRHAAGLSWDTVLGQNDTWPRLQSWHFHLQEISEPAVAIFSSGLFSLNKILNLSPLRTIILVVGDFRQLFSPEKTGFPPIPVLSEVTCPSLLFLIQEMFFNRLSDWNSSFLYKTVQQERYIKKS